MSRKNRHTLVGWGTLQHPDKAELLRQQHDSHRELHWSSQNNNSFACSAQGHARTVSICTSNRSYPAVCRLHLHTTLCWPDDKAA